MSWIFRKLMSWWFKRENETDTGKSRKETDTGKSEKERWASGQNLKFGEQEPERLRTIIKNMLRKISETKLTIILLGELGSGKSALINAFFTAMTGDDIVSTSFSTGKNATTVTKLLQAKEFDNVSVIDTPGIFESVQITEESIRDIITGRTPIWAKMTKHLTLEDPAQLGSETPDVNHPVCVVFVFKHGDEIPEKVKELLNVVRKLAGNGQIAYRLVLTHVDKLDDQFTKSENLPTVYQSPKIQEAVFEISKQTGVDESYINVVRNFTEVTPDLNSIILSLHALKLIVASARDQAEKVRFRQREP